MSKKISVCLLWFLIMFLNAEAQETEQEAGLNAESIVQCIFDEAYPNHEFCNALARNDSSFCWNQRKVTKELCYSKAQTDEEKDQCRTENQAAKDLCREQKKRDDAVCTENFIQGVATCLGENTTQDPVLSDDSTDEIENLRVKAVVQCLRDEADFNFSFCEKRVSNILKHCRKRARVVRDYFCYNKAKTEAAEKQCNTEYAESKAGCREKATQDIAPCNENYLRDAIACVERHSIDSTTTVTQD